MRKCCVTLMELLVALGLLVGFGGFLGWRTLPLIQKKKFQTEVSRWKQECLFLHQLAVNTQTDWILTGTKEGETWLVQKMPFEGFCRTVQERPKRFDSFDLWLEAKPLDVFTIEFYATGQVLPMGTWGLYSRTSDVHMTWKTSELFQQEGHDAGAETVFSLFRTALPLH